MSAQIDIMLSRLRGKPYNASSRMKYVYKEWLHRHSLGLFAAAAAAGGKPELG